MRLTLIPHPQSAAPPADIAVDLTRKGQSLALSFQLLGDLDRLTIPDRAPSDRSDNLWKTSCFEAFVRKRAEYEYLEFNLSPSTRWAAYAFDDYRTGMRDADVAPSAIAVARNGALTLDVQIALPGALTKADLRIGLSAIVEGKDGSKSWYALAHPPGAPDFHHADCFALELASRTAS